MRTINQSLAFIVAALALAPDAPGTGTTLPLVTPKKRNRFAELFGSAAFKNVAAKDGLTFQDGTTQTRLAQVVIPILDREGKAIPGSYIVGAYICKREKAGHKPTFILQMPSSGGKFKQPMIDVTEDETTHGEYVSWGNSVVDSWKSWRKSAVASGTASNAPTGTAGVMINDDELAELGLL